MSSAPGASHEPRQTTTNDDHTPNPSASIQLPPARQKLVQDVTDLYSCQPTNERVKRYTPDAVYDDMFGYATDRYKIAGQWFCLPKLFKTSENKGIEVVKNEPGLIQYKSEQHYTLPALMFSKVVPTKSLISLSLDPATQDSDYPLIKYHKEQASGDDYSHDGFKHALKEWQVNVVAKMTSDPEIERFKADEGAGGKDNINKYGSKTEATGHIDT